MKRSLIIILGLLLALGLMSGAAVAEEDPPWDEDFAHGHVLLIGVEVLDEGEDYVVITFRRCVDLAGGKALPKANHHNTVHTGRAGEALFDKAGHAVVPTAPLTEFANCEELGDPPVTFHFPPEE